MARFFKGVGVGTFLHPFDLRLVGIAPQNPKITPSTDRLMFHVARGTAASPYVSLTRSYGVARDYAIDASRTCPTPGQPAYVYAVDIDATTGLSVLDPVCEVAKHNGNPLASPSYHHDGAQAFLLGIVDPRGMALHLSAIAPQPVTAAGGTPRPANLSMELETMVRALRDAEILVAGVVPPNCVCARFDAF